MLAAQHGIETIVTLGSSMGGFASLVVGSVVRADLSVAISPQTNLDPEWNRARGDRRWDHWLAEMQAENYGLDSVRFAMEHGVAAKKTVVFFDPDDPLEQLHAAEIGDLPPVERRPVRGTARHRPRHPPFRSPARDAAERGAARGGGQPRAE